MTAKNIYRCVNCNYPASALYRSYGPSVLKLTKCKQCNNIVDKYVEYDPVIVMIDLILISKEAQRHVIYNTEFRSYWKLSIILMLLETYALWKNDSLFNIIVNTFCGIQTNSTLDSTEILLPLNLSPSGQFKTKCHGWKEIRADTDSFIWEKSFYVQFISVFFGILLFMVSFCGMMWWFKKIFSKPNKVNLTRILKAFSLANMSLLFTLPMLVWGNTDTSMDTRFVHYALVFGYSLVVYTTVFSVLYECSAVTTTIALLVGNSSKFCIYFYLTPYLRELVT